MPHNLIKREVGEAQDSIKFLLIEPADERIATTTVKEKGGKPNNLDTSEHVANALDAALKSGVPVLRATLVVDGEEMELPHDQPEVLADFVECIYVLHGWKAVAAIADDLQQMLLYRTNPLQYELKMWGTAEPPPGGVLLPEERSDAGSSQGTAGAGERLPGGMVFEEPPPRTPRINVADPAAQARLFSLRRRIGTASILQIREWQTAYDNAFTDLRLRVLRVARAFEDRALVQVRARLSQSIKEAADEAINYFQWHKRDAAEGALRALSSPNVQSNQDAVKRLRTRLKDLAPLAQAVKDRDSEMVAYVAEHAPLGDRLPEPYATGQKEKITAVERALAEYGANVAVASGEFPALYRFDVDTVLEAAKAPDETLGRLLFTRLKKTFLAAERIWPELHKHRPAKGVSENDILGGGLPELAIGAEAKDSIWSFPRIIEATAPITPIEDAEIAECAAVNIRVEMQGRAEAEAGIALLKGIGMAGLTIGMMCICPPAGLALDAGMSMADIKHTVDEYNNLSDAALCALNPSECFSEVGPSAAPIVLAVAGAAMVAI